MNKKFTVLVGLLMAVAVTGYSVSGTYAKYTEDFNASSSADIAIWDIQFLGKDGYSEEFAFDLFETVTDDANTLINTEHTSSTTEGEGDDAVTTTTSTKVIAPGTSGSFTIKIKNNSDVKAKVKSITLTDDSGTGVNIQYSLDGTTWSSNLADLDMDSYLQVMNTQGAEVTIPVQWRWAYETGSDDATIKSNDDLDTKAAGGKITATASITVIQATA